MTLTISTPSTANATDLTPTLSVAAAERCTVVPGAACGGAFKVITGFSVSGSAVIVTLASAVAVLPLVSRAIAVTRIVAPTEATIGIEITRSYGGLVAMCTLTAPGEAAGLIWDRDRCTHSAEVRCDGKKGARWWPVLLSFGTSSRGHGGES